MNKNFQIIFQNVNYNRTTTCKLCITERSKNTKKSQSYVRVSSNFISVYLNNPAYHPQCGIYSLIHKTHTYNFKRTFGLTQIKTDSFKITNSPHHQKCYSDTLIHRTGPPPTLKTLTLNIIHKYSSNKFMYKNNLLADQININKVIKILSTESLELLIPEIKRKFKKEKS